MLSQTRLLEQKCSHDSHGNFDTFSQDPGNPKESLGFTVLSFSELIEEATPLSDEDPAYWESFRKKQEAPLRQSKG